MIAIPIPNQAPIINDAIKTTEKATKLISNDFLLVWFNALETMKTNKFAKKPILIGMNTSILLPLVNFKM